MDTLDFFAQHPVFTFDEFLSFQKTHGTSKGTQKNLLLYYLKKGRLIRIRRELYASIPHGHEAESYPIDSYLVAGKASSDAVLAYHTALEYHGVAYSVFHHFFYLSTHQIHPFSFQSQLFMGVPHPKILLEKNQMQFEVVAVKRLSLEIRLTTIERTLVDTLTKPEISGGWEEVWRSLSSIPVLNIDKVMKYASLLENTTTVAKVGFFLESYREIFGVTEEQLKTLEKHTPKQAHYLDRKKPSKFVKRWNVMIPIEILERRWEEPLG